jgi:hypothetical protein
VVVRISVLDRLLNWFERRKKVREGALFHELDQWDTPRQLLDEVTDKVRKKGKGYRDD